MAKTKAKTEEYEVKAKIMGRTFSGKGENIIEALKSLDTGNVHGKVILTVSKGRVAKDRIIPIPMARRLFNSAGLTREVTLKQVSLMFQGV